MRKFFLLPTILLLSLISACKKDSSIGADILPPSDLLNVKFSDTFQLDAKTLADTFLRSDKLAKNFLGLINDPLFGQQRASIAMELDKPNLVYDDTLGPFTVDSVLLFLKYNLVYGDSTVPQDFNVYTLNSTINETQSYYSNSSSFSTGALIGGVNNYRITPSSRVVTTLADTIGTSGIMRIPLNNSVGDGIFTLGQDILRDSSQFKNRFPGILVENSGVAGKAMVEVNMSSLYSYICIFYKDKRGVKREMKLFASLLKLTNGAVSARQNGVNLFSNSLSSSVLNTISSGQVSDSICYILGQGGTSIRLALPTLTNLGRVAVNKAEVSITQIVQNSQVEWQVPQFLLLLKRNASGQLDALPSGDGIGILDSTGTDIYGNKISVYKFNISRYVQNISKGLETNTELYMATYRAGGTDGSVNALNTVVNGSVVNFSYYPSRIVVAGPNYSDPKYRMKLNITYTLLQ